MRGNMMSKEISFSIFLDQLEEYENVHVLWCAKLIEIGRQTLQSIYNHTDDEQLIHLMDSFINFVSLLAQCHSNSLSDDENTVKCSEQTSKEQNESQDLLPKSDIIKLVNNELQCPICNEWLFRATSANCNHTFCETCIKKWLKINKTCPVCRASIQYTSTSIAVDNFISNLCQLVGGFFKERRESLQNASIDDSIEQSNADHTIDESINDSNMSQLIEDDTYISEVENNTLTHPNMVRLIPHPQSPSTVSRLNSRPSVVSLNSSHPNRVPLSYFPQGSYANRRGNQFQPTSSRSDTTSRVNRFQFTPLTSVFNHLNLRQPVVTSNSPHPNRVQLTYSPQLNSARSNINRLQPTSSISTTSPIQLRTNTNIGSSSRHQPTINNRLPCHQITSLRPQNYREY